MRTAFLLFALAALPAIADEPRLSPEQFRGFDLREMIELENRDAA